MSFPLNPQIRFVLVEDSSPRSQVESRKLHGSLFWKVISWQNCWVFLKLFISLYHNMYLSKCFLAGQIWWTYNFKLTSSFRSFRNSLIHSKKLNITLLCSISLWTSDLIQKFLIVNWLYNLEKRNFMFLSSMRAFCFSSMLVEVIRWIVIVKT